MDNSLKTKLDRLYQDFDTSYLSLDPLELVRRYANPKDQEIAGFVAAALAIGQVDLIRKAVGDVLQKMGPSPHDFVRRFDPKRDATLFDGFVYRFYRGRDVGLLLSWAGDTVREFGSLEGLFQKGYHSNNPNIGPALSHFIQHLLTCDPSPFYPRTPVKGSGIRHFLADPADGSSCKRLNLYLRWMIRRDALDLGVWRSVSPSKLIMPVDTHIARLAPLLGLTSRKSADWRMAVEITESLQKFDPDDPVKFDFALCTIGKLNTCSDDPQKSTCLNCPLNGFCRRQQDFYLKE